MKKPVKINRIIKMVSSPFCKRDYDRFGVDILINNGFQVEVWEFTPFMNPESYKRTEISDPVSYSGHKVFMTKDEALKAISGLSEDCFVIFLFGYYAKSLYAYEAVSNMNIKYAVLSALVIPTPGLAKQKRIIKRVITRLRKFASLMLYGWKDVTRIIPFKYLGVKPALVNLAGGTMSLESYRKPVDKSTEILWLHSLDYDIYMKEKQKPIEGEEKLAVFIDEYFPFHPDYFHMGITPPTTPGSYYPLLVKFFDFLEKTHGFKVAIAAHPRSNYENHPEYFGGRSVVRGKTLELVRKAKVVIMHHSTAISFPVLFQKPIIFITTDELENSCEGPMIKMNAELFGKSPINLNNTLNFDFNNECSINARAFVDYKNKYIKTDGSKEGQFWEIVSDYISNI